jgi:hypothetical protein
VKRAAEPVPAESNGVESKGVESNGERIVAMIERAIASRIGRAASGAVALAWLACASLAQASDSGVGVVAEYRPASGRYTFERGRERTAVPVRIGTVVMAGDRVTLPTGGTVVLRLANGERTELSGPGTRAVPESSSLGKLGAFFGSIPALFDDEFRLEGTAASRGGEKCAATGAGSRPIAIPILAPGARIVAGERDLPLAWSGGCAPFVVTLWSGDRKLIDRESIEGRQVRLDDVPLERGRYEITIVDASGLRGSGALEAVDTGPALPPDLAGDATPLGVIAQAVWLSQHENGRWRLESFERLRPLIRSGDSLAGAIGDGVLWGTSP